MSLNGGFIVAWYKNKLNKKLINAYIYLGFLDCALY